jgi:O-acetyl-ADP-ribose deacetylase (regulator of RNase III)
MGDFELTLVDPSSEVCAAWELHFEELPRITINNGPFEELSAFDCMVSAANSFGLMDGGVDLAIIQFFGLELMDRVQERIIAEYMGEQPVGTCFIIETGSAAHPFLAHTPTMRAPMPITRTDNIYRAMWAMLLAVRLHNRTSGRPVRKVACPGLGTATGRTPANEAARQMAAAWRHFLSPPRRISWPYAITRQQAVGFGGDPDA